MQKALTPLIIMSFLLASCGNNSDSAEVLEAETGEQIEASSDNSDISTAENSGPETGSLEWAITGDWRGEDSTRDEFRNPDATLEFFQLDPASTIVEVWPGAGWYSAILAPWVSANDGTLIAAHVPPDTDARAQVIDSYQARFSSERFANVDITTFDDGLLDLESNSVDTIVTFRNVHNWMGGGVAETAFSSFFSALKPGGTLGVVTHRLPASDEQDPRASSGYVQEDYVIALAREAGFELEARSDINANRADTADHPFGVWTLPPNLRSSPSGEPENTDFNSAPYEAIGESDRMTLLFRKPDPEPEVSDTDMEDEAGTEETDSDETDTDETSSESEG